MFEKLPVHTAHALELNTFKTCFTKLPLQGSLNISCLTNMAEEREDKKRGRTWGKEETVILLEKWGRGQYPATSEIMYSQKAFLAGNKLFSKRFWIRRPGLRLLQNENSHINLGLQKLQRCAVEVR